MSGSKHLEFLLGKGLIRSRPSQILNAFYAQQVCRLWLPDTLAELSVVAVELNYIISRLDHGEVKSQAEKLVLRCQNLESKVQFIMRAINELSSKKPEGKNLTNLEQEHGPRFLDKISPNIEEMRSHLDGIAQSLERSRCELVDHMTLGTAADPEKDDMDEMKLLSEDSGGVLVDWLEQYEVRELKVEVDRAAEQIQKSLAASIELQSEKEELDSATKASSSEKKVIR